MLLRAGQIDRGSACGQEACAEGEGDDGNGRPTASTNGQVHHVRHVSGRSVRGGRQGASPALGIVDVVRDGLVFSLLPFIVLVALSAGFVVVFRQRAAARRSWRHQVLAEPDVATPPRDQRPGPHPWWGNPWLWLSVCAGFVVLGLFVWPGLFGGTFLFLPFVWVWRPRRATQMDPRTNGHSHRDPSG
jgi:hypothetical protein